MAGDGFYRDGGKPVNLVRPCDLMTRWPDGIIKRGTPPHVAAAVRSAAQLAVVIERARLARRWTSTDLAKHAKIAPVRVREIELGTKWGTQARILHLIAGRSA